MQLLSADKILDLRPKILDLLKRRPVKKYVGLAKKGTFFTGETVTRAPSSESVRFANYNGACTARGSIGNAAMNDRVKPLR